MTKAKTPEEKAAEAAAKAAKADAKKGTPVSAQVLADGKPYADPKTLEVRKAYHVDDHPDEDIEELANSFLKVAQHRYHDLGFGTAERPMPKLEVSIEYDEV